MLALHFSLVVFLFPLCASESTPTTSRKGPRQSPVAVVAVAAAVAAIVVVLFGDPKEITQGAKTL